MKKSLRSPYESGMSTVTDTLDKDFDYLTNACSACDCTGLIPANPHPLREDALDAYQDVYAYQPPKIVSESKAEGSHTGVSGR